MATYCGGRARTKDAPGAPSETAALAVAVVIGAGGALLLTLFGGTAPLPGHADTSARPAAAPALAQARTTFWEES